MTPDQWLKRSCLGLLALGLALPLLAAGAWAWLNLRPPPPETSRKLFEGVDYTRQVRRSPRLMVIHLVTVDLRAEGLSFLVTPGDPQAELPLEARTTSQFLEEFNLQLAVNGDGFTPWYARSLLDYYPRRGDPVDVIGYAASNGVEYSQDTDSEPTLYMDNRNRARIGRAEAQIKQAISGNLLLLENGNILPGPGGSAEPRTAVALTERNRRLLLIVIDGRQPGYSQGATLQELAEILLSFGAVDAINLDGGGSSTLIIEGRLGLPERLNAPLNHGIPGWERPVGNHLGIYARPVGSQE
jgi:hypothetical protein